MSAARELSDCIMHLRVQGRANIRRGGTALCSGGLFYKLSRKGSAPCSLQDHALIPLHRQV